MTPTRRVGRAASVLLLLTIAPIAIGVLYAIGAMFGVVGVGASGFSMQRLTDVFASRETWTSVTWTVMVGGFATVIAGWAAVVCTESLWNHAVGRRLALVPFAVPHIAGALAILLLVGQSGLLSRTTFALGLTSHPSDFPVLIYDRFGIGLALAFFWKEFPFMALTAFAVRSSVPASLLEAARSLGATTRQVQRRVVRPLILKGILPASISVFAFLIGQYEMASVLGPSAPPALPVLTFERMTDSVLSRRGEAYVLAVLALGIAAVLAWLYTRVTQEREVPQS